MAEVALSTEDMLLVMQMAGWRYVPEIETLWAYVISDSMTLYAHHNVRKQGGDKYGRTDLATRTDEENIPDLFNQFIQHQEGKHT